MGEGGGTRGTFSTRAAARILAVQPGRIRSWVKRRLIIPAQAGGRRLRFAFNDLLVMRLAKELLPPGRRLEPARRTFERVRGLAGTARPLTALKLENRDGRVVVRDGGACFEAESGQFLLDFGRRTRPGQLEQRFGPARARERFEEARRLAEQDPLKALKTYSSLAGRASASLDIHMRLAALFEREGDLGGALRHLLGAAAVMPTNAEVHLKLGLLYRRRGEAEDAIRSLGWSLECDPAMVEAHRNLAELYEASGRKRDALRHFGAVHRLLKGD